MSETTTIKTTDVALKLCLDALKKIAKGDGNPAIVATTAMLGVGKPENLTGMKEVLGPLKRAGDYRKYIIRLQTAKLGPGRARK